MDFLSFPSVRSARSVRAADGGWRASKSGVGRCLVDVARRRRKRMSTALANGGVVEIGVGKLWRDKSSTAVTDGGAVEIGGDKWRREKISTVVVW